MATALPSPETDNTWIGFFSAPQSVSTSATSRTASAQVGADSNTSWMIERLLPNSSGELSPRPQATTLGKNSVDTSVHEVPMVKQVLTPLSVTRPMFCSAMDSMQSGCGRARDTRGSCPGRTSWGWARSPNLRTATRNRTAGGPAARHPAALPRPARTRLPGSAGNPAPGFYAFHPCRMWT